MKNIEIFRTLDGSLGLYNKELDEVYHSRFGALEEAREKFINPCKIIDNRPLKILDICYGIGYNTKTALLELKNIELIDCVEIDQNLVLNSPNFEFDEKINQIIKKNLENPDFINFYIEDIRTAIKKLDKKYDIIFHDGFAPYKNPILWSQELIFEISKILDKKGLYVTYNHSKPVLGALKQAGLFLGKTIKQNKTIGTIASFDPELIKNPFNDFELGSLETKSAITYKDKNLNLTNEEILKNREIELKTTSRLTLSSYLKGK